MICDVIASGSDVRSRGMTPAGAPWVDPATAKQPLGDSSVDTDKVNEVGMALHWGEFGAARERMRMTLKTDRQPGNDVYRAVV